MTTPRDVSCVPKRRVRATAPDRVVHVGPTGRPHLDLRAAVEMQLASSGVRRIRHIPTAPQPMFEKFGVQKQIDEAFVRQVWEVRSTTYVVKPLPRTVSTSFHR